MSARSWRVLLLAVCACGIAVNARSLFSDSIEASYALGFQVSRTVDPALVRVDAVAKDGAAAASGLRVGDLLHLDSLSPGNRYRILTGVHPHERIALQVTRGTRTLPIEYVAGGPPVWRWDIVVWSVASFWLLGFATFIAWRRPDSLEARILCLLLFLPPASGALAPGNWLSSSPLADAIVASIGLVSGWCVLPLLAAYSALFGRPLSPLRRLLTWLTYACTAGAATQGVARLWMAWFGVMPWVAQSFGPEWKLGYHAIPYAFALACVVAAIAATRGTQRNRIAWTIAPLALFQLMSALTYAIPALFPNSAHGGVLVAVFALANVGAFLAPLGMTYALLTRRVLDIGFALNRVAIFSGVSIVIVGAFMLLEWGLGNWLQQISHAASLAVGAAIALLLGFSFRLVHGRVEHLLDRIFFRKRHEDRQAIRRFAREAAYVTDRQILLERTAGVLERYADASFVRILLHDGNGRYGAAGENDPAILALRTWHDVLDLHGLTTQLEGEFAYPIVARGRLIGALTIGPKRSQEAYAPDESDAIDDLARSVGATLDVLQQAPDGADSAVLGELKALRAAIVEGFASLHVRRRQAGSANGDPDVLS